MPTRRHRSRAKTRRGATLGTFWLAAFFIVSALGPLWEAGIEQDLPKAIAAATILLATVLIGLKVETFKLREEAQRGVRNGID